MSWLIIPENQLDSEERLVIESNYINSHYWLVPCIGSNLFSLLLACIRKLINRYSGERRICLIVNNAWSQRTLKKQTLEIGVDISVLTLHQFVCSKTSYHNTFVLHGEDISKSILELIVNRSQFVFLSSNHSLSIGNISIYDNQEVINEDDISNILNVRKFELHICHKANSQMSLIKKLIISNIFELKRNLSKFDTPVRICKATNNVEEVKYVLNQINRCSNAGYEVALLFKTREDIVSFFNTLFRIDGKLNWSIVKDRFDNIDVSSLELCLRENGYIFRLSPYSESHEETTVSVILYEDVKGTDFDYVILPFFDNQLCIETEMELVNSAFYYICKKWYIFYI